MKLLIDANLPFKLVSLLIDEGVDVIHTDDLPNKERTTDRELRNVSVNENRIVITKDTDFLDSHLINNIPKKLLIVTTGNIKNFELFRLFRNNFSKIIILFKDYDLIEINNTEIVVHEKG